MKRVLVGVGVVAATAAVSLVLMASSYEQKIRPNTQVGIIEVGGLLPVEAAKKLRLWWETERRREIILTVANGKKPPMKEMLTRLGLRLDDVASVAELPLDDFWDSAGRTIGAGEPEKLKFDPVFSLEEKNLAKLDEYVKSSIGDPRRARAILVAGKVQIQPEVSGYAVDRPGFQQTLLQGMNGSEPIQIPLTEAPKDIPDSELAKITEVVSEFSTSFPRSQTSRNTNLKLASGTIDGHVLRPGEVFSFNEVVGKRTIEAGYRVAGVYRNGRHDVGLAGGICQVSTTLYNAVLFSNLKIVSRRNHSMPVAYVPLGRDATVDYGSIDFQFQNDTEQPIAVSSSWEPGKLTFRILGKKDPGLKVELIPSGRRSWGKGVKTVVDRSLAPGKTKVIEKGSSGHAINMTRVVYQNGVEVKREALGQSHYGGGVRIVAVGPDGAGDGSADPGATPPPSDDIDISANLD